MQCDCNPGFTGDGLFCFLASSCTDAVHCGENAHCQNSSPQVCIVRLELTQKKLIFANLKVKVTEYRVLADRFEISTHKLCKNKWIQNYTQLYIPPVDYVLITVMCSSLKITGWALISINSTYFMQIAICLEPISQIQIN